MVGRFSLKTLSKLFSFKPISPLILRFPYAILEENYRKEILAMKTKFLSLLLCLAVLLCLAACTPAAADPSSTSNQPSVPDEHCTHADSDNNTICDHCQGDLLVELDLLVINDLHGKFLDSSTQPGVDELTSYLLSYGSDALLLSSGDTWQGSSESNLTQGKLMTEWMNSLDFAAMTLGNHEFDWGESYIEANAQLADFPFLAINIYDRETNQPVSYCQPSVMVERCGVQIGIIGAIGDCYSSISSDKTQDIYFKTGKDLTQLVKDEATRLRTAGADIIIYSLHDGYEQNMSSQGTVASNALKGYYDTSLSDGFVDIVFEAHIHKHYVFTDEYGVYHLQAGGENDGISYAQISYNLLTDSITDVDAQFISSDVYDDQVSHPSVEALLEKYQEALAPGNEVLGTNGQYRSSDELRNLVAQLYYEAGVERWGADYDIVLGGGFLSVRNPWNLAGGDVVYGTLQALFPFDNQLVLCSIKGSDLLRNFLTERDNYYVHLEDYGYQVWDNLDPQGTYYIVTDTYCSSYAPNKLTVVAEYDPGVYARDLLADYIRSGGMENEAIPEDYAITSISALLQICENLNPGETSQESYFVKGTIVSVANSQYGNVTIQDESGKQIYIYGMYDEDGVVRYDAMENPPQVGDTVILMGPLQHYVSAQGTAIYEMVRARLLEVE